MVAGDGEPHRLPEQWLDRFNHVINLFCCLHCRVLVMLFFAPAWLLGHVAARALARCGHSSFSRCSCRLGQESLNFLERINWAAQGSRWTYQPASREPVEGICRNGECLRSFNSRETELGLGCRACGRLVRACAHTGTTLTGSGERGEADEKEKINLPRYPLCGSDDDHTYSLCQSGG